MRNIESDKLRYEFEKYIIILWQSDEFLNDCNAPVVQILSDQFLYEAQSVIRLTWDMALRDMQTYKWPKDWRQAFKERWFSKWMLKRWPVIYKTIKLTEVAGLKRMQGDRIKVRYIIREIEKNTRLYDEEEYD